MKQKHFHIRLYIIIPVIFAGLAVFSSIGAYRITEYCMKQKLDITWPVFFWALIVGTVAFFCGLMIVRLILRPVEKFMKKVKQVPALASSNHGGNNRKPRNELEGIARVFEQVADILSKIEAHQHFPEIIGQSKAMRGILSQIMKVAPTDSTVLILGDSGTGKELVATSIYRHSFRKNRPLVKLNCVAIPEGLLESELFGHEKGSFTGASTKKVGKFELANGGTIFLDEIGDMPLNTQAKILRVLQEKEFERVGGIRSIKVDVRFIAATNKNLEDMVKEDRFREDLYYRLNVFPIHLPPLKERKEDIPLLVDHFLKNGSKSARVSSQTLQLLIKYSWPGNVRELRNSLERAAVMCKNGAIKPYHLPENIISTHNTFNMSASQELSLNEQLAEIEQGMIIEALHRASGIQVKAAELLGIKQRSLWHRIKKYGIDARFSKINKN